MGVTSEPGPRRGRHQDQRQPPAAHLADAVHLGERLVRAEEEGDQLRRVHRGAATEPDHQFGAECTGIGNGGQHHRLGRVGDHAVIHRDGQSGGLETVDRAVEQAKAAHTLVRDHQYTRALTDQRNRDLGEPGRRAGPGMNVRHGSKIEAGHELPPLFAVSGMSHCAGLCHLGPAYRLLRKTLPLAMFIFKYWLRPRGPT